MTGRMWHLARHDSRLFLLRKENLFFMLVMPILFMLFFSSVFRGGGGPEDVKVKLSVIDQDRSFLSHAFVRQLEGEHFDLAVFDAAPADSVELLRVLTIPASFGDSILAGRKVELDFTKHPDSNLSYDVAAEMHLHRAQVAFLGTLIRWEQELSRRFDHIDQVGEADRARLLALAAEPSLVTVQDRWAGEGRPVPSGAGQSIPGMLAMFVVMTVLIGGSESLTREKHQGTLARLLSTPFSRGEVLGGKVLHLTLVGLVQALVLMGAGEAMGAFHLFGIDFSWGPHAPTLILVLIPYAFSVACLTLFVGGLFRTTQQAESMAWLLGMILAAIGGCWWPLEAMPHGARVLAAFSPAYWAMSAFHALITFGQGPSAVILPSLILIGFGALFAWLGGRTMRSGGIG